MGAMTNSRPELLQQLQELGVETVIAEYDGVGDSGQIEGVLFGHVEVPHNLMMAVQDLFYELLEDLYGGWELNEGSSGQFTWNVRQDKINLVHNARIESIHTEEQNL